MKIADPVLSQWRLLPILLSGILMLSMVPFNQANAADDPLAPGLRPRNVILFIGDGMGVSTVSATRFYSVGVDGNLVMDQMPYAALSRVSTTDFITPDSAGAMTSMMSGINTNSGTIGMGPDTEINDFNNDGDGPRLVNVLEQAAQAGMKVGVISTARVTHATPAATYAHINHRDKENEIALQALPGDATYNTALGDGLDLLWGGGRRFFCPDVIGTDPVTGSATTDEEGSLCSRGDGRDLREEFQEAGYSYVWNEAQFNSLTPADLPSLGLFESSHMEYEFDRPNDLGGEPSLTAMTVKAIELLDEAVNLHPQATDGNDSPGQSKGFFLMVESGRIDHAHHEGNAFRALTDTEELDEAIGAAVRMVNLSNTTIIATADHSHVFNIAGYPLRPSSDLPYTHGTAQEGYLDNSNPESHSGILDVVYDIDSSTGEITEAGDSNGVPYTILGYLNGPGYRGVPRVDPRTDPFLGREAVGVDGPENTEYFQESAVPLGSETHSAEEVTIYAIGPQASQFRGTVKNSFIAKVMRQALDFYNPNL
jgi:alkaline phosphatase